MKENTTVVRGHFNPNADQLSRLNSSQNYVMELKRLALDAGYDKYSDLHFAFEPWMIDDRWLCEDSGTSWECLTLDPDAIYTALVAVPLTATRSQVMFKVRTMSNPRDEWISEIDIHYIKAITACNQNPFTYDMSHHDDRPLTFKVERLWGELDITLNGIDVHLVRHDIANATVALCDMLQRRADLMSEVEECA